MRNTAEIALGTNIGFVTTHILRNTVEIALGTNIGFVTADLLRNAAEILLYIGNEHSVCDHCVTRNTVTADCDHAGSTGTGL